MNFDLQFRRALIERGIYVFPLPTKQCSISSAHTEDDISHTLEVMREVLECGASENRVAPQSADDGAIENGELKHEVPTP